MKDIFLHERVNKRVVISFQECYEGQVKEITDTLKSNYNILAKGVEVFDGELNCFKIKEIILSVESTIIVLKR